MGKQEVDLSLGSPVDERVAPGLTPATGSAQVEVPPGGSFDLEVRPVAKTIGEATFAMLSYNGSIPGPTLRVQQGSEIAVNVRNLMATETTVHWHGLRLDNRYDGVPHETQEPIPPAGGYTHTLRFPDAGLFWYHPHVREDYAQDLGLYGNVLVDPADPAYWPSVDDEVFLTLDDILIEAGTITPYHADHADYVAMGRFGNTLLVAGETGHRFDVASGRVVRLYVTNTANTRVFKIALPGCPMKLVGGDAGRYEREGWVESVVVAPSERAIVDVAFDVAGRFALQHVTPDRTYDLSTITVSPGPGPTAARSGFDRLRVASEMVAERERASAYLEAPPDKTLALVAEMDVEDATGAAAYACPMHPDVVSDSPGKCPKCGMKLMPADGVPAAGHEGSHSDHDAHRDHADETGDGVEWEDLMVEVNRGTTTGNMRWKIVDRETGRENQEIEWTFEAGDQVKIRLVNEMESDHPMHHPFHIHGERFLVLARNNVPEVNLVWKDTVLIRTGEVVDILMDASNPGLWMAHCHIAEHMESGMMFSFRVLSSRSA